MLWNCKKKSEICFWDQPWQSGSSMECSVWKFKTESSISEVADFQTNPFRYFVRGHVKWKKLENLRDFSWLNWATNYNGDSTNSCWVRPLTKAYSAPPTTTFRMDQRGEVATSHWQSHHGVRQTNCTRWRQGLWILRWFRWVQRWFRCRSRGAMVSWCQLHKLKHKFRSMKVPMGRKHSCSYL